MKTSSRRDETRRREDTKTHEEFSSGNKFFVGLRVLRFFVLMSLFAAGCKRDDMADQMRFKTYAPSDFYADGAAARVPPEHTVARDDPIAPVSYAWSSPVLASQYPFAMTRADLLRGQQEFEIYCTPCHGMVGDGEGMVPERGFTRPPSFHTDRLRSAPPSYFYNVISDGIGAMYPYRAEIGMEDRWRVAAYIRALQLSQHADGVAGAGATQSSGEGAR